jgi:hypothetical protein
VSALSAAEAAVARSGNAACAPAGTTAVGAVCAALAAPLAASAGPCGGAADVAGALLPVAEAVGRAFWFPAGAACATPGAGAIAGVAAGAGSSIVVDFNGARGEGAMTGALAFASGSAVARINGAVIAGAVWWCIARCAAGRAASAPSRSVAWGEDRGGLSAHALDAGGNSVSLSPGAIGAREGAVTLS